MKCKDYNISMVRPDIAEFKATLPQNVTLVAATKYLSSEEMKDFLKVGINNFGENRVDDFLEKYSALENQGVIWHFIGHLQRNKAVKVIDKIDYLHSLDSLELAELIDKKANKPLKTFIEVSINLEESKNGVPYYEMEQFVSKILQYKNIELVGLMMMAVKASDNSSLQEQFKRLRILRGDLEKKFKISIPYLSMGMSDDYLEAIKEGATHIRLGRILLK